MSWYNEPRRHSLSARGIKTATKGKPVLDYSGKPMMTLEHYKNQRIKQKQALINLASSIRQGTLHGETTGKRLDALGVPMWKQNNVAFLAQEEPSLSVEQIVEKVMSEPDEKYAKRGQKRTNKFIRSEGDLELYTEKHDLFYLESDDKYYKVERNADERKLAKPISKPKYNSWSEQLDKGTPEEKEEAYKILESREVH